MLINEDLTKVVLLDAGQMDWIASPAAGVGRRMLYREGDEIVRSSSIVRCAPGSAFPAHGGASRALASLLITEREICGNRFGRFRGHSSELERPRRAGFEV